VVSFHCHLDAYVSTASTTCLVFFKGSEETSKRRNGRGRTMRTISETECFILKKIFFILNEKKTIKYKR